MMSDAIKDFPKQFAYEPEVEHAERLGHFSRYVVLGMGGSHLAAGLLQNLDPYLDIVIHRDYGLPPLREEDLQKRLIIASSYSGNTEEVLDGFAAALEMGYSLAAVTTGGKLADRAREAGVPLIILPDTGIQPRAALGFGMRALMKLLRLETFLENSAHLAVRLDVAALREEGEKISDVIAGKVPIIYASRRNEQIAYNWKIKFNETGKIPAFMNVLPELNHNEMTGFDVAKGTSELTKAFHFLFLGDENDDARVQHRMRVLKRLYEDRDLPVTGLALMGSSPLEKIFKSLLVADWAAVATAERYGLESEHVPMVEEFKRLIQK